MFDKLNHKNLINYITKLNDDLIATVIFSGIIGIWDPISGKCMYKRNKIT